MTPELRKDLVSGDWIVIAPGRAKRPEAFIEKKKKRKVGAVSTCPFEKPQLTGHAEPIFVYPDLKNWAVQIFPNKYPAFTHHEDSVKLQHRGPYSIFPAVGHHDVVVTRDHKNNFPDLKPKEAYQLFQAFRDRYLMFFEDPAIAYAFVFQNWGPTAGASIYHPHYQMIAIPVIPPDVNHSLEGSSRYYKEHKECVHCVMLAWEQSEKKRIIFENKTAIAFAPFVSRSPFEMRIFPKQHIPYFENSADNIIDGVVQVLQKALRAMQNSLGDPDYNFFVHTAPIHHKEHYQHYHWHIEVLPKVTVRAGFELGTGVDINVVDPDEAARLLRTKTR